MAWIYLIFAGLFEVIGALAMAQSLGFSKLKPTLITIVAFAVSIYLLTLSLATLPIGIAYAIWTGIGAAGTAIISIIWHNESAHPLRIASLGLIITGIIILKLFS